MRTLTIALILLLLGACAASLRPSGAPGGAPGGASHATATGTRFRGCRDCPEMVVVPAGRFLMGSPPTEPLRDPDEGPQREIAFPHPFAIARLAVTRGAYSAFVRATHRLDGPVCYADRGHAGTWKDEPGLSWHDPGFAQTDSDPVVCINIEDIQAYIAWVNARSGGGYRLPSEAEYEYVARAGTVTSHGWGGTVTHDQANFGSNPCCHGLVEGRDRWLYTSPGGAFGANAFGVSDMQGNVWEFVADCYTPSLAAIPPDGAAALATAACEKYVIRGAGWDDPPNYLRSANRYKQSPTIRGSVTGFRLVHPLG